jgi:CDP-glucose 4,6-dehydratase
MESVVMFNNVYRDKKVFITGDEGFKGTWLKLWLIHLGANVKGYDLKSGKNVLDYKTLNEEIMRFNPDFIFHLAAQAIVYDSYKNPYDTFSTNIMGTLNVLDSLRHTDCKVFINIVTDKVYKSSDNHHKEDDELYGYDPYSMSKVCSDLMTTCYKDSIYNNSDVAIANVRAGNVIGGGDEGSFRLIPDIVRAIAFKEPIYVRHVGYTRPYQHALDCLNGYLSLGQKLYEDGKVYEGSWNFGNEDFVSVETILYLCTKYWKEFEIVYQGSPEELFAETKNLSLDCKKAKEKLNWSILYPIDRAVEKTMGWYKEYYSDKNIKKDMTNFTLQQIEDYEKVMVKNSFK